MYGHESGRENVCAIVVTYHPDHELMARMECIRSQVAAVLFVDNGSDVSEVEMLRRICAAGAAEIICNETNLGIAKALNQGMAWAGARGFRYALTLDQDSTAHEGMVDTLLRIAQGSESTADIALVGASYDHTVTSAHEAKPVAARPITWKEAKVNITSGSLMSVDVYARVGPFREEFFIDCVDQDYCLKARRLGYRILVSGETLMTHALGDRKAIRFLGWRLSCTNHSPTRRYYSTRNRLVLISEYSFREPLWIADLFRRFIQDVIFVLLFEKEKLRKFRAVCRGVLDFAVGRMGPITKQPI